MSAMRSKQGGTTLIEVLVAILITATGVMGTASMQLNSVKFNQTAKHRSAAVFLANDITDRLRANRAKAIAGDYDRAVDDAAPTGDSTVAVDLREWLAELGRRVPSGEGAITRNGSRFTIVVRWNEARLAKTREDGSDGLQAFAFTTEL